MTPSEQEAAPPVGEFFPGTWSSIREAIRGSKQDLTAIPLSRAVLLVALPTMLEMSMQSLLTIVDVFFVARLGSEAVATLGLGEAMLMPVYALGTGLSAAATGIVSRSIGKHDPDAAAIAAVQVIGVAATVGLVVGLTGALLTPLLLSAMGASGDVVSSGTSYVTLVLAGSVTLLLQTVINAVFRSAGDTAIAMRSLWLANILNMLLTPCLAFGLGPAPRLGVLGAAVGMTASRAIGVGYQALMLRRARGRLVIRRRHVKLASGVVRELARIAIPATMGILLEGASWLGLVRIVSTYGSVALASYTIVMRIVIFALLPSWGLGQAVATLVGQNLGAGSFDRARRSVSTVFRYGLAFLAPVNLTLALAPSSFVSFFAEDPATSAAAADGLRIVAIGLIVFAYGTVAVSAFIGAGDTKTPMVVNFVSLWFFKVPLAWVLAEVVGLGPRGVFIAIASAYVVQSVVFAWLFRRVSWAKRRPIASDDGRTSEGSI